MNFFRKALAAGLLLVCCGSTLAVETIILNGSVGNADFEATETVGDPGLLTGPQQYIDTPNWFNASGSEGINFTNDSQTGGSSQPNSRAGMPFQNRVQINNTGYTIGSAGEVFNISYDFGAGGPLANWDGDEIMRTFLFTSTVAVDGFLDATTDITELGGDNYAVDRAGDGQWTTRTVPAFYTSTLADVGQTVYFGMEFQDPNVVSDLFPRIDVVRLTTGTPEPFVLEFNAGLNPADGTNAWAPNIDQGPQTGGVPTEIFTFAEDTSSIAVNDPSVPGITGSYRAGSQSRGPSYSNGAVGAGASAFEVWFKPDDLAGGDQVLLELGGGQNGSYISLQDGTLSFHTTTNQGGGATETLSAILTDAEWTQVVANWDGAAGEYELFVNGVSVDSATGTTSVRWGGANQWGLGYVGGDTGDDLAIGGPLATPATLSDLLFSGELGIFRYYDKALTAQEVADSFDAIAASTTLVGDSNGDGVVNTLDIDPFVLALTDAGQYAIDFPAVDFLGANDINEDGVVNTLDIDPFVGILTGPSAATVPEPLAATLCAAACSLLLLRGPKTDRNFSGLASNNV